MTLNILAAFATLFGTFVVAQAAPSETARQGGKPTIVLVHGAFADGSSWGKVISLLQAKGYHAVAVQNPLTSLAEDVAATERVVNQQTGPVILVGHSWGGVVITQAGNNPKVKGLVYVSAAAPDSGQSLVDATAGFPAAPWLAVAIKDEGGFLTLPAATVAQHFAQDLSPADQRVIAATQVPWFSGCPTHKVTKAAWRDKPSWWVLGENDHMIAPDLQAKMAADIKAKVTKLRTSHVAMLADPKGVTAVITAAAESAPSEEKGLAFAPADDAAAEPAGHSLVPALSLVSQASASPAAAQTARDIRGPAPVVPLANEPPAKLVIDPPLADSLAQGRVVIQYRADNLRIVPVFGPAALDVSPRIGHIHVTVDDTPWRWADASGEPLIINRLPPGPHKVLIELVNPNHQTIDQGVVSFEVPERPAANGAQPGVFTRTELQRHNLSASGLETVQSIAQFPVGVASGRHSHPGEEVGYILQGTVVMEFDGGPSLTLKAGDVFFIPAGRIHNARNIGTGISKMLSTYIVQKGKPLATPAGAPSGQRSPLDDVVAAQPTSTECELHAHSPRS